jgi:hypothetical protein
VVCQIKLVELLQREILIDSIFISRLQRALNDTRKRLRIDEIVVLDDESPKSRVRKDGKLPLSPQDVNASLKKAGAVLKVEMSASGLVEEAAMRQAFSPPDDMSPIVEARPTSAAAAIEPTFGICQPSIDAAKLYVSKLKYKELQHELKVNPLRCSTERPVDSFI